MEPKNSCQLKSTATKPRMKDKDVRVTSVAQGNSEETGTLSCGKPGAFEAQGRDSLPASKQATKPHTGVFGHT
jgi:hypothetical protein